MTYIFLIALFITLLIGIPAAFAVGISGILGMMLTTGVQWGTIAQNSITGISSLSLLALPLFLIAGKLMNTGGITQRLFAFAKILVGWLPGGLGHVNVLASLIFAGMSGSAVADASGLGEIELKAMRDEGYDDEFTAAVTATSSLLGPMIPPSIALVLYATVTGTSTGSLFMAGIVPGLLMAAIMMVVVSIYSVKKGYPRSPFPSFGYAIMSFFRAIPAMMTVVIILMGIYTGIFTATEAAAVAVAYSLFLSMVVYREVTWKDLFHILVEAGRDTAAVCIILSMSQIFSTVLVRSMIPQEMASLLASMMNDKIILLLSINVFLLIVGMFLSSSVAVTVLVPILLPVLTKFGVNLVHFGIIFQLNMSIGTLTPPFGILIFVMAKISGLSSSKLIRAFLPWIFAMLVALALITFIPQITLALPVFLGKSIT